MSKPIILVKNITSLSEARYCAGMMLDYISFEFNPNSEYFVDAGKFIEIKGWLSGIKILGSFENGGNDDLLEIIQKFNLDGIILGPEQTDFQLNLENIIIIQEIFKPLLNQIEENKFDYLIVNGNFELKEELINANNNLLIGYDFQNVSKEIAGISGFAFLGSKESQTGINQYEDLMDALEILDEKFWE